MALQRSLQFAQTDIESMLDALVDVGYYVWPNALDENLCQELLHEVETYEQNHDLEQAGIGRGGEHQLNQTIRRDKIRWLDASTDAQVLYLSLMQQLQQEINRALYMGLFEYESHFALYEQGDFYKKHSDSFRGKANRMLTTVAYLNPNWQPEFGGELVIYNEMGDKELLSVLPEMGKLVIFLSEQTPHEVRVTHQARVSIAGWFRLNSSRAGIVDPAL